MILENAFNDIGTVIDLPCSGLMRTDDIIIADFNDDGHPDIAFHNFGGGQKDHILINYIDQHRRL